MNSRNWFKNFSLTVGIALIVMGRSTTAFANADQDANDMLQAVSQNENDDAVVRWGVSHNHKVTRKVSPISESSFTRSENEPNSGGRSPASVNEPSGRSPATESVKFTPADQKLSAKTIVRNLAEKKAYQEMAVIVNDLGFFPSTLFVTQGIPVRLYVTGASKKSQCFMMDTFGIRRQIQNQKVEEITFTPEETGSFSFSCPMNGAKGTVLVKELDVARLPASVSVSHHKESDEENSDDDSRGSLH